MSFQLSRWVFLRLLGLTYLLAFVSLAPQIIGLIGSDGLLPAAEHFERARDFYGTRAYYQLLGFGWLSASDGALHALCWGGIVLSVLGIVGIAPVATFGLLWICYLSLTVAGQTFLSFQWDVLLLEAGLLAGLYAPLGWWPVLGAETRAAAPIRWLLWALVFKLMFLSGITKLVSGDPTWWGLTALTFHYQTQPIPTWISWYAHNLPAWFHTVSVVVMFCIELGVPFLVFAPARFRRTRAVACALLCLFQVVIAATGNYGFFNLLTIVLCLTLLDDHYISRLVPRAVATRRGSVMAGDEPRVWRLAVTGAALAIGFMSAITVWHGSTYTRPHPEWSTRLVSIVRPIRSINGYGLFRTMTTERPEIIVEGSTDGITWTEYAFRWKPGDVGRRPRFVQPHMPRLDWQMWFAALDPSGNQHWLAPMLYGLLENRAAVLGLLGNNPFPAAPPRYVRLAQYQYDFTTPEGGRETGAWWRREFVGYLTEPISR